MKSEVAVISNKKRRRSLQDDMPVWIKVLAYIMTTALSISAIIPFLLTISVSLTEENALLLHGYKMIPPEFSTAAYEYIFKNSAQIINAYGVTIFTTVVGTVAGVLIMSMLGYVLSRQSFPWKLQTAFFVYFTQLFSGGMLATYVIFTTVYNLRDTLTVQIIPAMVTPMYVLILRTYMNTSVPPAVVESAKIDGASEFRCYSQIVMPMSVPCLATIALFLAVMYWNQWKAAFLYVLTRTDIIPIQLLLNRIEKEIAFLANNAGEMTASEAASVAETIPSESVKMALLVIVVVPIVVAYPFFQKYFVKGITVGSVKG